MKASLLQNTFVGIPISVACDAGKLSNRYLLNSASQYNKSTESSDKSKTNSVLARVNKLGRKTNNFAHEVQEHVRLRPKITDTVKGKLSLGARVLKIGGFKKIFKHLFGVKEGEKLLKASQCYLSTTSGPIAGLLFISTEKVAFCSDRSMKIPLPNGEVMRVHYKVMIPLEKIKCVYQSNNVKKPSQKYMDIVTVDNFDFWFMGFINFQKTFRYLQHAISHS